MYDTGTVIIALIISLLVFIAIFLLLREVVCWYWKINTMVKNQEITNQLLKKIADHLETKKEPENPSKTE